MTAWACADDLDYYAVRVEPTKERMACDILANRNILSRLAVRKFEQIVKINRRVPAKVVQQRMLLPGIIFVAFPKGVDVPWFALKQRIHVIRGVIGMDHKPTKIKDVDKLMRLFDDIVFSNVDLAAFNRVYNKGDRVKLVVGPFANFEAEVSEVMEEDLRLLCDIFGRSTPLLLKRSQFDCIEPVAASA